MKTGFPLLGNKIKVQNNLLPNYYEQILRCDSVDLNKIVVNTLGLVSKLFVLTWKETCIQSKKAIVTLQNKQLWSVYTFQEKKNPWSPEHQSDGKNLLGCVFANSAPKDIEPRRDTRPFVLNSVVHASKSFCAVHCWQNLVTRQMMHCFEFHSIRSGRKCAIFPLKMSFETLQICIFDGASMKAETCSMVFTLCQRREVRRADRDIPGDTKSILI